MITRRFRSKVLVDGVTNTHSYKPFPDLARSQVYQVGNAITCGDGTNHYQVSVFSDIVLPASATYLFEAATTCAGTTDDEHWDDCRTADSNLKVDDGSFETIWFATFAIKGFYNSNTAPEGYRQNERVIRTIDASSGSLSGATVLDGDTYGGCFMKTNNVSAPVDSIVVSSPGLGHAYWCLPAAAEVTSGSDTCCGPTSIIETPARIIKVNTTAGLGTEVTLSTRTLMDAACVDPLTGDLWVSMHDTTATTAVKSNWVLNQYNSSLTLISSTATPNFMTCITFSNFGGVPIVYCEETGTTSTTLRRFNVGTLSFLSNITSILFFGSFHVPHGNMTVDSVGGYLYRTSAFSSLNNIYAYRLSDFVPLGPCTTVPYGAGGDYLTGPVLSSDNGKLYAHGLSTTPPNNTRSWTGCWVAPFYELIGTYPTAYQGDILSVEEDWELKIAIPLANQGSPCIRQRMMISTACGQIHVPTVRVGGEGGEMEYLRISGFFTSQKTASQNTPSTPNEAITWTTRMALSGSNINATIPNAACIAIPDLNTLSLSAATSLNYIGDYKPEWSISGIPVGPDSGTAIQGTELFFDRCATGVTHLKRLTYRINMSNSDVIEPIAEDTITNPWPACVPLDPHFVTSFLTGPKCTSVLIDQTNKIGYFLLQDMPNTCNKVDLINRVITDTATTTVFPILRPYTDGYSSFDETGNRLYFTADDTVVITQPTSLTLHNTLAFDSSNVAYTIRRSGSTTFLYTINMSTGDATFVGDIGIADIGGLTFDGSDLYAITGAGVAASTLYKISPITGAVLTTVGATGYSHIVAISCRFSDGVMYGWVNGDTAGLVTISKITGVASSIGGVSTQISDMSFHPTTHVLYGTQSSVADLVTINVSNGVLTTVVPASEIPFEAAQALGWDNEGTPNLWFKYGTNPSFITQVDLPNSTLFTAQGPLLGMVDTTLMTVTKGDPNPNGDVTPVGVFDISAGFGYVASQNGSTAQRIYKYNLSTLAVDATLALSPGAPTNPNITAAAIDPGNFAYFIHSTTGSGLKITKVALSGFSVSATTTLTGSATTARTATFMNGYLYVFNETGFGRKISPSLTVVDTLQLPKTPAQAAYTITFSQTVPVSGQVATNPDENLIYVGVNSNLAAVIYKVYTPDFIVIGSLPVDTFFRGFHNIQAVGLNFDPVGYGMPYGDEGYVIEFDFNSEITVPFPPFCGRMIRNDFITTASWRVPPGVTSIYVECFGGGGGGGDGNSGADEDGGGGGGGAAYAASLISVNPGDVFVITIGTGGTGDSSDGTATDFNAGQVLADFGLGAIGSVAGTGGLAANSVGDYTADGGVGLNGITGSVTPVGGANGGDSAGGGIGGAGGAANAAGSPGTIPGGGGGGGGSTFGATGGAVGAQGLVRITWASDYGLHGDIHQTHTTGQTNYSIQHCTPLNQYTTTKGIGLRRKWILALSPPPIPIPIYINKRSCNCQFD